MSNSGYGGIVAPNIAAKKIINGAKTKCHTIATPHPQPIKGRQPATIIFLDCASALFIYNCPFANSCACFSAIVATS